VVKRSGGGGEGTQNGSKSHSGGWAQRLEKNLSSNTGEDRKKARNQRPNK